MSGPVDVLAVLKQLRLCAIRGCGCNETHAAEIMEASAAVAELIEVAKNHLEAYGKRYDASVRIAASMDLRAALAKVGAAA
jgi:hypothetical protein